MMMQPEALITLDEAARLCKEAGLDHLIKKWWKYHCQRGNIQAREQNGQYYVTRAEVDAMIVQQKTAEAEYAHEKKTANETV